MDNSRKRKRCNLSEDEVCTTKKLKIARDENFQFIEKNNLSFSKYLKEQDVGITQRVNTLSPFSGVIKQRYSDFVVNEIDKNGLPVILTDLKPLEKIKEEAHDVSTVLDPDTISQLNKLVDSPEIVQPVVIKVELLSKAERQKIHETIRQQYSKLCSTTQVENDEKVILVSRSNCAKSQQKGAFRKQPTWPPNQPNYMQFVLFKENKDTMEAINYIAKSLRMKPSSFTYAGVKDKRAKTSQLVTVYRVTSDKLSNMKIKDVTLGNYKLVDEPLKLGDLGGNRFKIVIRNVTGEGDINETLSPLKEKGFINYYGMQRFGTSEIATHQIGKALLLGNWKEAVELILKPRRGEDEYLTESRRIWWETRDASAALSKLRRKHTIEGRLLEGLDKHNQNDLVNALNFIPRNTRLMYIHSYQSYIWNLMVSKRIEKFGMKLVDGDLILRNSIDSDDVKEKTPIIYNSQDPTQNTDTDIFDVVMPLPGSNSIYPENEIASWYQEIFKSESITREHFSSKVKMYSLQGSYRKIIVKPTDLSWSLVKYTDPNKPLIRCDLDMLTGILPDCDQDGHLTALCIEFALPSSSYATMALREVINVDTSVAFQKTLN